MKSFEITNNIQLVQFTLPSISERAQNGVLSVLLLLISLYCVVLEFQKYGPVKHIQIGDGITWVSVPRTVTAVPTIDE